MFRQKEKPITINNRFKSIQQFVNSCNHIKHNKLLTSFQKIKKTQSIKIFHKAKQNQSDRQKSIQQQFIQHCAIFIQSRVRGYFQRKKYVQFLPVYRRVRELLYSVYSGWKIRKIMKLPPIKKQILQIKNKIKNQQNSQARISKRQLIDDINRLTKRGLWIEVLWRNRDMNANRLGLNESKQNCSMYGNVKSKSIKNVFKGTKTRDMNEFQVGKSIQKQKQKLFQSNTKRKMINEVSQSIESVDQSIVFKYDDIPIKQSKGVYNIDALVKQQNQIIKTNKPILRKSTKPKIQIKIGKTNQITNNCQQRKDKHTIDNKQKLIKTVQSERPRELAESGFSIMSLNFEQHKPEAAKQKQRSKIKMTLSKKQNNSSSLQSSAYSSQSAHHQQPIALITQPKINQSSTTAKRHHSNIDQLQSIFYSNYLNKKITLKTQIQKIDTRYSSNLTQTYKQIANKFTNTSYL